MAINSGITSGRKIWGTLQGVKKYTMTSVSGTSGVTVKFTGQATVIGKIKRGYRVTGPGLTSKANVLSVNPAAGTITIYPGNGTFTTGANYTFTS
jgi:hypothetical protein